MITFWGHSLGLSVYVCGHIYKIMCSLYYILRKEIPDGLGSRGISTNVQHFISYAASLLYATNVGALRKLV